MGGKAAGLTSLVTGGGGFLGSAIVRALLDRGDDVRTFSRGEYPWLIARGVDTRRGDIADPAAVDQCVAGCSLVFHVAAKTGVWGRAREYDRANIFGTKHIIAACRRHDVPRLVFTSSPSAVFTGRDESGIDERQGYPASYLAHYPRTKAAAEALVLAAADDSLATVALRPHLIWGPGDPHLVPRILERARRGRLVLIGDGHNRVDSTYIDNAADAHLLAADALTGSPEISGSVYFISNDEPLPIRTLLSGILKAGGLPPIKKSIPPAVAYFLGACMEGAAKLTRRQTEPPMTRFVAQQLSSEHWYDLARAKRDLGFVPRVSIAEGLNRLTTALRNQ